MQRTLLREWLLVALLLTAAAFAGSTWQVFGRLDALLFDLGMTAWRRPALDNIVIVAIDEKSLAAVGRWPWPRSVHATLIERLTEARAGPVGFDVIVAEQDAGNPAADLSLASAIRSHGKVVLPMHLDAGTVSVAEVAPAPDFRAAAAAVGHIGIELDPDGLVRRVFLEDGTAQTRYRHFAAELLRLYGEPTTTETAGERATDRTARSGVRMRDRRYIIPFAGSPGHFQRVSYVDVLLGRTPIERLSGKIVIVGATAVGMRDDYSTPVSGESTPMPGVEITANIIDGMARGIDVREAPRGAQGLISGLIILAVMLVFPRLSPRGSLIVALGALIGVLVLSLGMVRMSSVWFGPSVALAMILLTYPLWSWRRLEAAMRFLASELRATEIDSSTLSVQATTQRAPMPRPRAFDDFFAIRLNAAQDAADRLRYSRRVFRQSLAGLPVAVVVGDRDGVPILANQRAQEFLGIARRGAPESIAALLTRQEQGAAHDWREILAQTIHDRITHGYESTLAGSRRCLVTVAPYALVEDVVVGVIVTVSDVSELKRLEREREEILQFISHDMRAPLNSVLALLELAPGSRHQPELIERNARIAAYAHRALALVEGMLHQARADRLDPMMLVTLDVGEIFHEACDQIWPLANRREQTLDRQIPPVPALVRGDQDLLLRALLNLLSNAVKYGAPGSTVSVSLLRDGDRWILRVCDQGPGISREQQSDLFQPYRRLVRKDREDPGGIGLGLAFVRTVAEKHGGSVAVHSEQGAGATFEIKLPIAIDSDGENEALLASISARTPGDAPAG